MATPCLSGRREGVATICFSRRKERRAQKRNIRAWLAIPRLSRMYGEDDHSCLSRRRDRAATICLSRRKESPSLEKKKASIYQNESDIIRETMAAPGLSRIKERRTQKIIIRAWMATPLPL